MIFSHLTYCITTWSLSTNFVTTT